MYTLSIVARRILFSFSKIANLIKQNPDVKSIHPFATKYGILKTKDEIEGVLVKGFDNEIWQSNAPTIVYNGNKEKFIQNKEFLNLLLSTKGQTIVEASPDDNIWGIGLAKDQEESKSIFTWKGTNWLGIVLTELREEFLGNKFENGYLTLDEFKSKMINSW